MGRRRGSNARLRPRGSHALTRRIYSRAELDRLPREPPDDEEWEGVLSLGPDQVTLREYQFYNLGFRAGRAAVAEDDE